MKKIILCSLLSIFGLQAKSFQAVDINCADFEQIALLPGVGEKLAKNIVAYREHNGQFTQVENLRAVSGMTDKKLNALKDKIILKSSKKNKKIDVPLVGVPKLTFLSRKTIVDLTDLEAQVLKVYGLDEDFDRSLHKRARKAAYLPKLAASFEVDQGNSITEKMLESSKDSRLMRGGHDFGIGIRAIFDLDRLIYNKDELDVAKLSLERMKKREEVISKLHKQYFRYVHLMETIKSPLDTSSVEAISLEFREIEAMLDSMSKGFFTRHQITIKIPSEQT